MLTTERLTLRRHRLSDFGVLAEMDADEEARRFAGGIADPATTGRYLREEIAAFGCGQSWKFAIDLRDSGTMVGWCWLKYLDAIGGFELGYEVARPHWGRGIATEAARDVMRFAFDDVGIPAVHLIVDPANAPSRRVIEKLGRAPFRDVPWRTPSGRALVFRFERGRASTRAQTEESNP